MMKGKNCLQSGEYSKLFFNLLLFVLFAYVLRTDAAETEVHAKAEIVSCHLWRGRALSDSSCFQPSVSILSDGLGLNLWGTFDLESDSGSKRRNRLDATAYYSVRHGKYLFAGGVVGYFYQDDPEAHARNTGEIFAGYSLNMLLAPSMTFYYDFDEVGGYYASFSVTHSLRVAKGLSNLDMQLSIGGGNKDYAASLLKFENEDTGENYEPDGETLMDLTVRLSMPIDLGRNVRLVPGARYMRLLDHDARQAARDAGEDTDSVAAVIGLVAGAGWKR